MSTKVRVARFLPDLVGADVDVWGPHVSQGHAIHQSIPGGVGVRGLVAVEGIGEGEMICTIPYARLSLTAPTPLHTRPSPERIPPSWAALAVHLLTERSASTTFRSASFRARHHHHSSSRGVQDERRHVSLGSLSQYSAPQLPPASLPATPLVGGGAVACHGATAGGHEGRDRECICCRGTPSIRVGRLW